MSDDAEHIDEIEKYLTGQMGQFEHGLFEHKLSLDPELAEMVNIRRVAIQIAQEMRTQELRDYIRRNAPRRRTITFWQSVLLYSSAAAVLFFAISWALITFYFPQNDLALKYEMKKSKAAPSKEKENTNDEAKTEGAKKTADSQQVPATFPVFGNKDKEYYNNRPDSLMMAEAGDGEKVAGIDIPAVAKEDDEYRVKVDEMLSDTTFVAVVYDADIQQQVTRTSDASMSNNASPAPVQAYKPDQQKNLKQPAENKPAAKASKPVTVEFWKSPINYRGYIYDGKKLKLFGVENTSGLQLKFIGSNLYLVMGGQVYPINKEDRYNSYWPETDKRIIQILK